MENYTILAVDDEEHILELIEYNLRKKGFDVLICSSGEEALDVLERTAVDLLLLDIMMDGMDGIEVLRRIREQQKYRNLPVILLTAKNEESDKVLGLEYGADDYVSKPFGVHELAARIKAVLRRYEKTRESSPAEKEKKDGLKFGRLFIDKTAREVTVDGKRVDFALKEFELLYLLAMEKGTAFTREELLGQVWGYDYYGESRTIDVHIRNVRKKLEEKGYDPDSIRTVRGIGYKFQPEETS